MWLVCLIHGDLEPVAHFHALDLTFISESCQVTDDTALSHRAGTRSRLCPFTTRFNYLAMRTSSLLNDGAREISPRQVCSKSIGCNKQLPALLTSLGQPLTLTPALALKAPIVESFDNRGKNAGRWIVYARNSLSP